MEPVRKQATKAQTNYSPTKVTRSWDDAYEAHQQAKGDWVKLDEGTVAPVPKSYLEREESDEQAVNDAVVDANNGSGTGLKGKRLSKKISEKVGQAC